MTEIKNECFNNDRGMALCGRVLVQHVQGSEFHPLFHENNVSVTCKGQT